SRLGLAEAHQQPAARELVVRRSDLQLPLGGVPLKQRANELQCDRLARVDLPAQRVRVEGAAQQEASPGPGRRGVGEPRRLLALAFRGQLGKLLIVVEAFCGPPQATEL